MLLPVQKASRDFVTNAGPDEPVGEKSSSPVASCRTLPQDAIVAGFKGAAQRLGYAVLPGFPLKTTDPSLLLINSTMAPLKEDIATGLTCATPVALVQQCFRAKVPPQYLHGFEMMGLLAPVTQLQGVLQDTVHILETVGGFDRNDLRVVLDPSDLDLWEGSRQILPEAQLISKTGNDGGFSTRWKFGANVNQQGRGLTFAVTSQASADLTPLGNVIIIEPVNGKVGESFVEFGFGVEALCSAHTGGSIWQLEPYKTLAKAAEGLAGSDAARGLTRLWVGALCLAEHDVAPGPKGGAYIMRKLIRDLGVLVLDEKNAAGMLSRFLAAHDSLAEIYLEFRPNVEPLLQRMKQVALKELSDFEKTIEAKKTTFLRKGMGRLTEDEARRILKETHGLPEKIIDDILLTLRNRSKQ